jgi:hypothetical protein
MKILDQLAVQILREFGISSIFPRDFGICYFINGKSGSEPFLSPPPHTHTHTLVLIKINYGQNGDQKGSFIQQTQIIMGLRIFYP